MTIERPMFPPRRDNPLRLVGGFDVEQPQERGAALDQPDAELAPGPRWRTREGVHQGIAEHEEARDRYAKGVAWLAAAEAENLPQANIEAARQDLVQLHAEMIESARRLIVVLPTDPKALVDLLMYLEKHFSLLPHEINGRSLAFYLLRATRLSLREIANYRKGRDPRR